MNHFRFAVQASAGAASSSEWCRLAQRTEQLGYSTLFVPDHLDDGQLSPVVALTSAALSTTKLRVGSLVFDNDYRHPVVLAREMATLDLISGGRLEVGIGAGWKRSDYDQTGISYDKPGVRIDRLSESLQIITSLWREGNSTFSGEFYNTVNAVGKPTPIQENGPPLVIGGGGKKILTLAAKWANIVGINPSLTLGEITDEVVDSVSPDRFQERIEWVKEASGTRFKDLELQCLTFLASVVEDRVGWLSQFAPQFGLNVDQVLEIPIVLVGTVDEIIEDLLKRRKRFGLSYWVIHQHEMEEFAPVVAALDGK